MRVGTASIIFLSCLAAACGGDRQEEQKGESASPAAVDSMASGVDPGARNARDSAPPASAPPPGAEPPPVRAGVPSTIGMPPADTQTPPLARNAEVTYVCESGLPVVVAFDADRAAVRLPDGRDFTLTRASGGAGAREEYRGSDVTLVRVANVIELSLDSGATRMRCSESSATA